MARLFIRRVSTGKGSPFLLPSSHRPLAAMEDLLLSRVSKLPAEPVPCVLERVHLGLSLAELVQVFPDDLRQVFPAWISSQAVGVPLSPFSGSPSEISFLVDHLDGGWLPSQHALAGSGLICRSAGGASRQCFLRSSLLFRVPVEARGGERAGALSVRGSFLPVVSGVFVSEGSV